MDNKGTFWQHVRVFFKDSETIVWARAQTFIGAVWTVLVATNLVPIFSAFGWEKYVSVALMFQGIVTEYVRRRREPHDLGVKTIADLDTVVLPIKVDDEMVVNHDTGVITVTKAEPIPAVIVTKPAGDKLG
jgi:hypothetical protein